MTIRALIHRLLGLRPDPAGPRFVISQGYQLDLPSPVFDSRRPFRILNYLETRRLLKPGMLRRPRPVSLRRLQQVHDPQYIRSLQDREVVQAILGFPLEPAAQDAFLAFQRLVCGGTLVAAHNALKRNDVAVNLGGGLHHAARDRGSGFCAFNDVAVAVDHVRRSGFREPVLVVDLDLHDGDGTRAMFADDPMVHAFSIHNRDLAPPPGPHATSIALGTGVKDRTYLDALTARLPDVFATVRPGLVFYLAGSDPGVDDWLGDWRVTMDGMLARDRFVMSLLRPHRKRQAVPTVVLLAGGYGPAAWRHGAAFLSWLLTGDSRLDVPLEMELPIDHYRRLARLMRHPGLLPSERETRSDANTDWGLTEADLGGAATPGPGANTGLFLGLFSQHGLELLLEQSGLMANLGTRGHRKLAVQVDLDDPLGHTVRVVTGHRAPEPLIEVKLRVGPAAHDRRRNYLVVEWLLLQDVRPDADRNAGSLLPGQRHPGTGLLRDMAAALFVAAEKLEAVGLVFTPSHFHLARLARGLGRFPDPRHEAHYLAISGALRGLALDDASRALEGGRLRDAATGEIVRWVPRPMVIPVDSSLRDEFHGDSFRAEVMRAAAAIRLVLDP